MTFDAVRRQAVLFGGLLSRSPTSSVQLNDTWTWDGGTWTQQLPANNPPRREDAAMAHDSARQMVVLFGSISMHDTWTWDGHDWTEQNPSNGPPAQAWAAMIDDTGERDRCVRTPFA